MTNKSKKNFIISMLAQGITPNKVEAELVSMGWHPLSARRALEQLTRESSAGALPNILGLDLGQMPTCIDAGDCKPIVLMRMHLPQLCLLGNFLTPYECQELISLSKPRMRHSKVIIPDSTSKKEEFVYTRTSDQTSLPLGRWELVDKIHQRVARITRWPEKQIESLQVVRYQTGAEFAPHHDYLNPQFHANLIARLGQRVGTMILYLNTPPNGGATAFPDVEIEIFPQQGNALLFTYPKAHADTLTLHTGVPLGAGEKWIATFFFIDRVTGDNIGGIEDKKYV